MVADPEHPPGPATDLANIRRQGVQHLIAYCLNDSCAGGFLYVVVYGAGGLSIDREAA